MIKVLWLFFGWLSLTSAQVSNGTVVNQEDFKRLYPFMVFAAVNCNNEGWCRGCTGALVSNDTVLLAAHCFCKSGNNTYVFLDSAHIGQGRNVTARLRKRKEYKCGDKETYQANVDLAVLTLDEPVRDIVPVPLECGSLFSAGAEQSVKILGYKVDNLNSTTAALRVGEATTTTCNALITDAFCADEREGGATSIHYNNSGGPLLSSRSGAQKLIGVAHATLDVKTKYCVDGNRTAVKTYTVMTWTDVAKHCDWIRS